jgi:hypothetical protein
MSASYWKFVGENIAKGVGGKTLRRLGSGGKVLGRAGAVVGIGFLAYEFLKNYKDNIENEPAYQEMIILQAELEKWISVISCLGREPIEEKEYGSFDEGGAINALYRKKALKGASVKDADPKGAYTLVGRSMNYIRQTENLPGDDRFEKNKKGLVSQLRKLQLQISKVDDYRPIQKKLGQIVDEIRPIAAGYSARIYDCSREIQKTMGSNAAWAAISMTTLGLVKKPQQQLK